MLLESQGAADVMQSRISALVASILAVLAISSAGATAHPRHRHQLKLPSDYAAWSRVATCEEGGWYAPGGKYPDALGIAAGNYAQFGGRPDYGHLSMGARVREIKVADRLIRYYHVGVPDQWGCAAW